MKVKCLFVQWMDAQAFAGWQDPDHTGLALINSIGFVVKEDKYSITLSSCLTISGDINAAISIPKKWILKKKTIKI